MGLGGAPHDAGLVHGRAEIGEGGRAEVVAVVGEQALGLLIARDRRDAGGGQHLGGVADGTAQDGQRVRPLRVDISGEQGSKAAARRSSTAR